MRRPLYSLYLLAGLLIALGALAGLFFSQPATAQIPKGSSVAYDQTVRGEVTSLNGTEHRFTGCRGEMVGIAVTANDFSPRIELYSEGDADPLASATTGSHSAVLADIPLPASSLYTLVVSGRSRTDRGDYSLTLEGTGPEGNPLSDIPSTLNLTLGQVVTGTLPVARVEQWRFRGCDGDTIHAQISSDRFAPSLSLYAPSAERPIATAEPVESGNEGMSAEIRRVLPESGIFVLAAAGTNRTDTGLYELALTLESAATPPRRATVISEVTATATPTPAAGPRVRRGAPTPKIEPSPTRQATAQVTTPAPGELIMPGMGEGAFRIIDLNSVGGPVNHVVYAPNGDNFASAGEDGIIRIWDAISGRPLDTLVGHDGPVTYLAYAPSGDLLASAGVDGTVRLWDASGMEVEQLDMRGSRVNSVAFSPDGAELVATNEGGDVFVWDVAHASDPERDPEHDEASIRLALLGHEAPVYHASFSPDGELIATGDAAGIVRIWDVASGALRQTLPVNRGPGSGDPILSVVFSHDSSAVVVGGVIGVNQASVQIWDIATGDPIGELAGHDEWGSVALLSPDGTYILSAGRADPAQDGPSPATVRLWDSASGALRIALLGFPASVVAASFRPNGDELLTSDGTSVYIWPAAMIKVLAAAYADPVGVQMPVPAGVSTTGNPSQPSRMPTPTRTSTPTPTPTRTVAPTATPTPTVTPTATPLELLTPTFLPFVADVEIFCTVTAQSLNLRAGPGTAYDPPITLLANGALLMLTGRNAESSWLQVAVLNDDLDPEISGWVSVNFVFCTGEVDEAPVVEME